MLCSFYIFLLISKSKILLHIFTDYIYQLYKPIIFTDYILIFFQVVVLALATLALAEPEADPAYLYRGFYGHPHYGRYWGFGYGYLGYRGYYGRSAYGYSGPGNSYTHVDRLHKREADAQVALPAGLVYNGAIAPAAFAPLAPYAYPTAIPTALTSAVTDVTHIAPEVTVAAAPVAPYFAPYAGKDLKL